MKTNTSTRDYVQNFINSLNLPLNTAQALLVTAEDCQEFFENFYMRSKFLVDDLLDYREHKIAKSSKTIDTYIEEIQTKGIKETFESTFYQYFSQESVHLIEKAISEGKTSPKQLFLDFKKNPNKNILKNIL